MRIQQWKKYIAIATITATLLTGCGQSNSQTRSSGTSATTTPATSTTAGTGTVTSNTTTDGITYGTSTVVVDKEFSAKDLEVGYDESTGVNVILNGNSIETSSTDGVTVKDSTLTITKEGTYIISGTLKDGQIIVDAADTDKIQIVLNGVNITCSNNAPIYVKTADKVFVTLAAKSENSLTDGSEYVLTDDTNVDGVIFSKADLTLNGEGTLTITGNYKHGIASKDDLVITSGTYNITAVKDGLNGKDNVKIKDGTITISVTDGNGIQSKNGDDTTKGYVYICGGTINITKAQEGIEGTIILIEDGTVTITAQDDGLNATSGSSDTTTTDTSAAEADVISTVATTNTTTTVATTSNSTDSTTTSDDATTFKRPDKGDGGDFGGGGGFGKGGGAFETDTNSYLIIAGGTINVDAAGDGIDSNGCVLISGGTIYVNGPTNDGNAGFDYNGTADITGGTILVAGSAGMAQGFSETSTQYSILYNFTAASEAGTEVKLTDADGNVVFSYTPTKQYQSVVISTKDLKKDATYTISSGNESAELTLSSVVTSGGVQGTGMGGHGGGGRR